MGKHNTAFLFPGQGAQYVGMGKSLYEQYDIARETFEEANDALGFDIKESIFNGTKEELQKTEITQPAILTTSVATMRVLNSYGYYPRGAAGLSLGEYGALVASGALAFRDALPLVKKRGKYMQEAVPEGKGTMLSVLGLTKDQVEDVCSQVRKDNYTVVPANYNSPKQIVVSGEKEGIEQAEKLLREHGAKKVKYLNVSAPFHCELLDPAAKQLEVELNNIEIGDPQFTVISNVTAEEFKGREDIREKLIEQVKSPVLLHQSFNKLIDLGFTKFVEVGPGNTMCKLLKKIDPKIEREAIETPEQVENLC